MKLESHSIEPLTDEQARYVRDCVKRAGFRPALKECFINAQKALLLGDTALRLRYAEGVARTSTGWVHHGWLILAGKVVDVTWGGEQLGMRTPVRKEGRARPATADAPSQVQELADEYRGKMFELNAVVAHVQGNGAWGAMLDTAELLKTVASKVR